MDFLPSQIARLVLGYLKDTSPQAFGVFLKSCPLLKECFPAIFKGNFVILKHAGLDLLEILDEYSKLYALIQKHFENSNYEHSISQLTTEDKLHYLLNGQNTSTKSNNVSDKLETNCSQTSSNRNSSKYNKSSTRLGKKSTNDTNDSLNSIDNEAINVIVEKLMCESEHYQAQSQRQVFNSSRDECDEENSEIPIKQRLRGAKSTSKSSKDTSLTDEAIAEQNAEAIHSIIKVSQSTETSELQVEYTSSSLQPPPLLTPNNIQVATTSSQTNINTFEDVTLPDRTFDKCISPDLGRINQSQKTLSNVSGYLFPAHQTTAKITDPGSKPFYMTATTLSFTPQPPVRFQEHPVPPLHYTTYSEQDILKMPTVVICDNNQQTSNIVVGKQNTQQLQKVPKTPMHFSVVPTLNSSVNIISDIKINPNINSTSNTFNLIPNKDIQCTLESNLEENIMPIMETPENIKTANRVRLNMSQQPSPHSSGKSHIRALDFSPEAPPSTGNTSDFSKRLFKNNDIEVNVPIATRSPAPKLSDGWDKVQGAGLILSVGSTEKELPKEIITSTPINDPQIATSRTSTAKKKDQARKCDKGMWDFNLRALLSSDVTSRLASPPKACKKRKKTTNKILKSDTEPVTSAKADEENISELSALGNAIQSALNDSEDANAAVSQEQTKGTTDQPKSCTKRKRITKPSIGKIVRKKSTTVVAQVEATENVIDKPNTENLPSEGTEKVEAENSIKKVTVENDTDQSAAKSSKQLRKKCNIGNSAKKTLQMQLQKERPPKSMSKNNEAKNLEFGNKRIVNSTGGAVLNSSGTETKSTMEGDKSLVSSSKYITPDMPKTLTENPISNTAKRNLSSILETPLKCDISSLIPITPRFFSPVTNADTPITRLLKESNGGSIDLLSIPTPNFPITPGFNLNTQSPSYVNRPTDYSTSSSYYQPSEPEQNRSIEQMMEECKKAEALKPPDPVADIGSDLDPKQTMSATVVIEKLENYVLHEISLPEFETARELDRTKYCVASGNKEQGLTEAARASPTQEKTRQGVVATATPPDLPEEELEVSSKLCGSSSSYDSSSSSSSTSSDSDSSDSDCEVGTSRNTTVINVKCTSIPETKQMLTDIEGTKPRVTKSMPFVHESMLQELEAKRQRTISSLRDGPSSSSTAAPRKKNKKAIIQPRPANARRMPARVCKNPKKSAKSSENDGDSTKNGTKPSSKENDSSKTKTSAKPEESGKEASSTNCEVKVVEKSANILTETCVVSITTEKCIKTSPVKVFAQTCGNIDTETIITQKHTNSGNDNLFSSTASTTSPVNRSKNKSVTELETCDEKTPDTSKENIPQNSSVMKPKRKDPTPKKLPPSRNLPIASKNMKILEQLRIEAAQTEGTTFHLSSDEDDDDILAPFEMVEAELLETSSTSTPLPAAKIKDVTVTNRNTSEKMYFNSFEDILKKDANTENSKFEEKMPCDETRAEILVKDLMERGIHLIPTNKTPKKVVHETKTGATKKVIASSPEEGELISDDNRDSKPIPDEISRTKKSAVKKELRKNMSIKEIQDKLREKVLEKFGPKSKSSKPSKSRKPEKSSKSYENRKKHNENSSKKRQPSKKSAPKNLKPSSKTNIKKADDNKPHPAKSKNKEIEEPRCIRLLIAETEKMQEDSNVHSNTSVDHSKEGFSMVDVAEGCKKYFSYEYDENNVCKRTLADYKLEILNKNITAKVYKDETDTEVDKIMSFTPFTSIFELRIEDPYPYPSVLGDLYAEEQTKIAYGEGHKSRKEQHQLSNVPPPAKKIHTSRKPSSVCQSRSSSSSRRKSDSSLKSPKYINASPKRSSKSDPRKSNKKTSKEESSPSIVEDRTQYSNAQHRTKTADSKAVDTPQCSKDFQEVVYESKDLVDASKKSKISLESYKARTIVRSSQESDESGFHIENGEIILSSKSESPGSPSENLWHQSSEDDFLMTYALIGSERKENSNEAPSSSAISTDMPSSHLPTATTIAGATNTTGKKRKGSTLETSKPEKIPKKEARELLKNMDLETFLTKVHSGKI